MEERFTHLSAEQQREYIQNGLFAGASEETVRLALLDFEEAEINAIGDCMGGDCMLIPQFKDFIRQPK